MKFEGEIHVIRGWVPLKLIGHLKLWCYLLKVGGFEILYDYCAN